MTKTMVRLLLISLLAGASASPAAADGFKNWTVCGGTTFATCASVRLNVVGTNVTLSVKNLSGLWGSYGGTVFTAIGLTNVPSGVSAIIPASGYASTMSGPTRAGDTPGAWSLGNGVQVGGGTRLDLVAKTKGVNNGIASSCLPGSLPGGANQLYMNPTCGDGGVDNPSLNGGWVTLSFDVSQTWDPGLAGTELLIKGQSGPNGASTECLTGVNCDVVPEPFTIALLGSGLAGMGGLGLLRRRRRSADQA